MIKIKIFKSESTIDYYDNFDESGSFRNNDEFAKDQAEKAIKKIEALKEAKK